MSHVAVKYMSGDVACVLTPIPSTVGELKKQIHSVQGTRPLLQQLRHRTAGELTDDDKDMSTLLDEEGVCEVTFLLDEAATVVCAIEGALLEAEAIVKLLTRDRESSSDDLRTQIGACFRRLKMMRKRTKGEEKMAQKVNQYFRASDWEVRMPALNKAIVQLIQDGVLPDFESMHSGKTSAMTALRKDGCWSSCVHCRPQ